MMELKEYQRGALDALVRWLEVLENAQRDSETMIEALQRTPIDVPIPDEFRNYPKTAWQTLKANGGVAATAANTLTALTKQTDLFPISVSKYRRVAVKPCSLPPH